MKIHINYDLLEKIKEAKVGFSLQELTKTVIIQTIICTPFVYISNMEQFLSSLLKGIPILITLDLWTKKMFSQGHKEDAKKELNQLSAMLKDINVNTNLDLLSKSYVYKKEYKLKLSKNYIPHITQNKYIMVPTYDKGEEKEVSLVQEHVIGSNEYALSHGTPKKVLKLAYNPI